MIHFRMYHVKYMQLHVQSYIYMYNTCESLYMYSKNTMTLTLLTACVHDVNVD